MTRHSSALSTLLLVLWLSPGVGLAQAGAAPPSDAPVARESAPRALEETPPAPTYDPYAPPVRERRHVAVRLLAETGAGLVTAVPGAALGFALTLVTCNVLQSAGNGCILALLSSIPLGASVGFSLGVLWGGALAGNNGSVLGAFSGTVATIGAGLLVASLSRSTLSSFGENFAASTYLLAPLGAICSLIVYELTSSDPRLAPRTASRKPSGIRLQPTLALTSRGGLVGLGGTF